MFFRGGCYSLSLSRAIGLGKMTLKEEEEEETFESDVITSSSPPFPPERRTSFSSEAEVRAFVNVFALFCVRETVFFPLSVLSLSLFLFALMPF